MAITFASTTDGEAGIQATMEAFGLEPDAAQTPEAPADPATTAPATEPAADTTAAAPETAEETQVEQEVEHEVEEVAVERGADGKFTTKQVPPGVQKRIDKATKKQRDAEAERDEIKTRHEADQRRIARLEEQFDELRKNTAAKPADAPKPEPEEIKPVIRPRPKIEAFSNAEDPYEAHQDALMEWHLEKKEALDQARLAKLKTEIKEETASETEAADRLAAFQERVAEVSATIPDYEDVWKAAEKDNLQISGVLNDAVQEYAADGLDVHFLYHLAKHPDLAKRLTEATLYDPKTAKPAEILAKNRLAARELAKLETEVRALVKRPETASAPTPKPDKPAIPNRASKAPAPIEPVRGGGPTATPDPYTMTVSEYREYLRTPHGKEWYMGQGGREAEWRQMTQAAR